jgi:hypothetical protein
LKGSEIPAKQDIAGSLDASIESGKISKLANPEVKEE